jgi:hypothetical protein
MATNEEHKDKAYAEWRKADIKYNKLLAECNKANYERHKALVEYNKTCLRNKNLVY